MCYGQSPIGGQSFTSRIRVRFVVKHKFVFIKLCIIYQTLYTDIYLYIYIYIVVGTPRVYNNIVDMRYIYR